MKPKKIIYDVFGVNNYTHVEDHHYFTSKKSACDYLAHDIYKCLTPNEDNGMKPLWSPEDIHHRKWNLVEAADEYTWRIVKYSVSEDNDCF